MRPSLFVFAAVLAIGSSSCRANSSGPGSTGAASTGSASVSVSADPPKPFVLKIPEGLVVCGYVQDDADPSKCGAIVDRPEGVAVFQRAGDHVAQLKKGHVVPSCSTEGVVGTCDDGLGLYQNYYAPTWTTAKAKRNCAKKKHRWVE